MRAWRVRRPGAMRTRPLCLGRETMPRAGTDELAAGRVRGAAVLIP